MAREEGSICFKDAPRDDLTRSSAAQVAHRAQLEKEAAARAVFDARMAREAQAREAALARRRAAEAGFRAMLDDVVRAAEEAADDPDSKVAGVSFTLNPGDVKCKVVKREGEDGPAASARFCAGAPPADHFECTNGHALDVAEQLGGGGLEESSGGEEEDHLATSAVFEAKGDYGAALASLIRLSLPLRAAVKTEKDEEVLGVKRDELRAASTAMDRVRASIKASLAAVGHLRRALEDTPAAKEEAWAAAAKELGSLVRGGAPTAWAVWLARSRLSLGDFGGAEGASAAALQHLETSDKGAMRLPFDEGAPKTLALTIGAAAALERGRLDKSIKFVQAGLRHDPDSAPLKKQYDGLKALKRKTEAVDKHLKKGYSVKALDALDEAFGALDALSHELEGSNLDAYRATLHLRACTANAKTKRYEVAFPSCDAAVDADPDGVAPRAARAQAYERDDDFENAVRDWRFCVDAVGGDRMPAEAYAFTDDEGNSGDLRRRLQEARRAEENWEKRRDHARVLELPANVDSLGKDRKCYWLKKQHKKLARIWHPDKARGSPVRAQRKMTEVSDAKQALAQQYGC